MIPRLYRMSHDCPNCGIKDEKDMWGGARMGSSSWGHDWMCCSEECGLAWAEKIKGKDETKKGRKELAKKWEELASQADFRMGGEPYYGYAAEQQLRNLGRIK